MKPVGTAGSIDLLNRTSTNFRNLGPVDAIAKSGDSLSKSTITVVPVSSEQNGIQRTLGTREDSFKLYGPDGRIQGDRPASKSIEKALPVTGKTTSAKEVQIQQAVEGLQKIEAKVKAHEAAHKSAGGALSGPVSYSYTRGPDGKNYITGGEVPISVPSTKSAKDLERMLQTVVRAALAPADPSPQDLSVAAAAASQQQYLRQQESKSNTDEKGLVKPEKLLSALAATATDKQEFSNGIAEQSSQDMLAGKAASANDTDKKARPAASTGIFDVIANTGSTSAERSQKNDVMKGLVGDLLQKAYGNPAVTGSLAFEMMSGFGFARSVSLYA